MTSDGEEASAKGKGESRRHSDLNRLEETACLTRVARCHADRSGECRKS